MTPKRLKRTDLCISDDDSCPSQPPSPDASPVPLARTGITDLSDELLELILVFLGDLLPIDRRSRFLGKLMLVCRRWRAPALRALVKRISICSLDKLQNFLHYVMLHGDVRWHVHELEMITSIAEVSTLERQMASGPIIASISVCTNLAYIKIGGVHPSYANQLFDALKRCPKLMHFAYRNMTDLYRFSWYTLVELIKDLPALSFLQFTGGLEEDGRSLPTHKCLPPTLTSLHLTHTRTSDRDLGRFLALATSDWRFMALSRVTPGMTDHGLLANIKKYGPTLTQLNFSELRMLPGATVNQRGPHLLLDRCIPYLQNLTHLQVRGPHCSLNMFRRLPQSLVTLDVAGCPGLRPEWVASMLLVNDLPAFKTFKLGLKDMEWPLEADAAVAEACIAKGITLICKV